MRWWSEEWKVSRNIVPDDVGLKLDALCILVILR